MAECMIFHYRESDNILTRFNPNTKLFVVIAYSVLVSSSTGLGRLVLSALVLIPVLGARLPLAKYLKESFFFIILAISMSLSYVIGGRSLIDSASYGIGFLAIIFSSLLLTDSTMPEDIARSLGLFFSRIIGKRAFVLATLTEITISMIPIIIDSTLGILEARKARLASFFRHPVHSLVEFTSSVFSNLLDKAVIYTDAIYSRCYDASRCIASSYRIRDYVTIFATIVVLVIFFSLR